MHYWLVPICLMAGLGCSPENKKAPSEQKHVVITYPTTSPHESSEDLLVIKGACINKNTVYIEGSHTASMKCQTGLFSFPVAKTESGEYNFSIYQAEDTGTATVKFGVKTLVWKKTINLVPKVTLASPTSNPFFSNESNVTISGSCVDGNNVILTGDATETATCASGSFSINVAKSVDGLFNIGVTQKSPAGTASPSLAFQWNRDTVAPAAPSLTTPVQTPFYSANNSVALSGSCEPLSTVYLSGASTDSIGCVGSTYSFTVSKSADGTYAFGLIQKDKSGNSSGNTAFTWIRSTSVPNPPVITAPSNLSYNSNLNSFTISGTCDTGNKVEYTGADSGYVNCVSGLFSITLNKSSDGLYSYALVQKTLSSVSSSAVALSWNRDTAAPAVLQIVSPSPSPFYFTGSSAIVAGTCEGSSTIQVSGAQTFNSVCSAGTFSILLDQASLGTYNYSLTQTDLAGNVSSAIALSWVRDLTPPNPVTIISPVNPLTNNQNTILLTGSCETGATVNLSGSQIASTSCASGAYSFSITKTVDSVYTFNLNQSDLSGNVSTDSAFSWTRDTVAPLSVVITSPASSPYTSSASILNISGNCETGASISLTGSDTQATVCSGLSFSFSINKTTDASYLFGIVQTDVAGNSSISAGFTWDRVSSAPPPPSITTPASNPLTSNTNMITISGSCITGNTVEIAGSLVSSVVCVSDAYSFIDTKAIDGTYTYNVSQKNASLITSSAVTLTWIRDSVSPSAPTITNPIASPSYSNSTNLLVSGACEDGAVVSITGDDSSTTICAAGAYSFNVSKLADSTYNFSLYQTDVAGNTSGFANLIWNLDRSAPNQIVVTLPFDNPYISADTNVTISGECEPLAAVSVSGDASAVTSCSAVGTFSISVSALSDGIYSYQLKQTDLAGNSSASFLFQWTRDTVLPSTPTVISPSTNPFQSKLNSVSISVSCDTSISPTKSVVVLSGDVQASDVLSPAGQMSQDCNSSPVVFEVQKQADGDYSFSFIQENPNNSTASAASGFSWSRDTVAPAAPVLISPASSSFTAPGTLAISGNCDVGNLVTISGSMSSTSTCNSSGEFAFSDPKLVDGTYNYSMVQTDSAGNDSLATVLTWIRDANSLQPPTITLPAVSPYLSNSNVLTLSGTCTGNYLVTLGGDATASDVTTPVSSLTQNCANGTFTYVIAKSADGTYNFTLKQTFNSTDSSNASFQWNRDTTAPVVSISSAPSDPNVKTAVSFTFSSNEAGSTFECKLDAGSYSTCTSPKAYVGVANAPHTFSVRAIDAATNVSSVVSSTWTQSAYSTLALYHLDNGAPTVDSSTFTTSSIFNHSLTAVGSSANDTTGKFPVASPSSRTLGTSIYYTANSSAALNAGTDTMTIEGYIKINTAIATTSNYYTIVSKSNASPNMGWELRLVKKSSTKYNLEFLGSLNGTTQVTAKPGAATWTVTAGTWYYFAVTYNLGTTKFYWNSTTSKGTGTIGTAGSAVLFATTAPLRLGSNLISGTNPSMWLAGALDELRISQIIRTIAIPTGPYTAD